MAFKVRVMFDNSLEFGSASSMSSSLLIDSFEKRYVLAFLRTDTANYCSDYADLLCSLETDSDWD